MVRVTSVRALSVVAVLGAAGWPAAQAGLLDQVLDSAKQVVKDKAASKETSAVGNAADAVLNGRPPANPNDKNGPATDTAKGASRDGAPISAYQNYDFATSEDLLFEDEFREDEAGEFAVHWQQNQTQGAVAEVLGRRALMLSSGAWKFTTPAIKAPAYLGDAFTVEFDTYVSPQTPRGYGSAPSVHFLARSTDAAKGSAATQGHVSFGDNSFANFSVVAERSFSSGPLAYPQELASDRWVGRWHHIALAWRDRRLKVYVDQFRVYASPDLGMSPRAVAFEGFGSRENPTILSGVRIANGGAMKVAATQFTDTKIVSRGIHFDTDRATLRPESMGEINRVAEILRQNAGLRFEIQGHTDRSGTAQNNQTLSQQRAEAVKAQLVAVGIAADRLSTKGLGDTQPMASNDSFEGRAANRRVEFVRKS